MSEYQYYEFQAVDRALTAEEMAELRAISTRAKITPRRLQNVYSYGDFKGDPLALMTRYFDAFVYVANWGTHRLMLRLPADALVSQSARPYLVEYSFDIHPRGDALILEFESEDEDRDEIHWITDEEAEGWLPALLPLRGELAQGDVRALYLGWLAAIETLDDEDVVEPPAPPGLGNLSPALRTLAEFLRIDEDLLAVAAAASAKLPEEPGEGAVRRWIATLPPTEKDELLLQLAGDGAKAHAALLRRFRETSLPAQTRAGERTVSQLLEEAEARREVRLHEAAEREATERARREREAAIAREKHLASLAGREDELWRQVDTLIEAKQAKEYDRAVELLTDLRDLGVRQDSIEDFAMRIAALREQHAKRRALIERLIRAELLA